jgi:hypothetical protein
VTDPIKRLNYFDHQFLHAADFADEQNYHLNMRRRHNRVLHTSGIAEGLEVSFNQGESKVSIQPGTAYDGNGREMIVLDKTDIDLQSLANDATGYLFIKYNELPTDTVNAAGVAGDTRMTETPIIDFAPSAPGNPTMSLILAVVARKGKLIDSLDLTQRPIAGAKAGDLIANSLTFRIDGVGSGQWPKLSSSNLGGSKGLLSSLTNSSLQLDAGKELVLYDGGQVRSNDSGYRLSFNSTGKRMELQTPTAFDMTFLTGSAERMRLTGSGNLGIGTNAPDQPLTIQGSAGAYMNFKGGNGAYILQVGADSSGGVISTMTSQDLQLRAGSNSPMLTIKASGNVGIGITTPASRLDVGDRMRIRQGPLGTAALSFFQTAPSQDVAMLMMANDTQFGLWSVKTSKWGWLLDMPTGNLGVGVANPTTRVDATGGEVKWGNSSRLSSDQGGSLELGGDNYTAGVGVPFIDFHYNGKLQDFNVRLQNDADGRFTINAPTLQITGNVGLGIDTPTNKLHVNDASGIRQNYLYLSGGNKWSSLTYNAYHNSANSAWVFPDTTQAAITAEIDTISGWKPRFELFATNQAAPTSWVKKFAVDLTNGAISSPMWNVNMVMSFKNGPLPVTSNQFTTGGGTLLIFASGSAYLPGTGTLGAYVYVDYNAGTFFGGYLFRFTNEVGSHKTFIPSAYPVKVPAGTHTITIVPWGSTQSDGNDYFFVSVLELPF